MAHKILQEVVSYALIASVFITGTAIAEVSFSVYWFTPLYVLSIVAGIFYFQTINVRVFYGLIGVVLYSFLTFKSDIHLVIKQVLNIVIFTLVFYYLIANERFSVPDLFRKYTAVAKVILLIGFVQVLAFVLGMEEYFLRIFPFLTQTNITYRFQSLSDEPSFIGITFGPIVFLALHNIFYRTRFFISRTWGVLFILAYLMTLSSTCLVTFVLMLFFLYFKNFTPVKAALFFVFALGVALFSALAYQSVPLIRSRVDDTLFALEKDFTDPAVYRQVNLSTYALLSNLVVTSKTLEEYPAFGRGLGTHEASYVEYLPGHMRQYSVLNAKDANSMALRLLSETGVVGFSVFLLLVLFLYTRSRRSFDATQQFLWVLNTGIAIVIMAALLRHGNYTSSGKILFLLLYYYSYREIRDISAQRRQMVVQKVMVL